MNAVHIIGGGPTGMSLAWEIIHSQDTQVIIYDRKTSAGGSWWEPEGEYRDLHAHRIVFDRAFVNTQSLFKEMGIRWDTIFEPDATGPYSFIFKMLESWDYVSLASLASRVLLEPSKYKTTSLRDALGPLSDSGKSLIETLPLIMDGVTWDVMSAFEFVQSFNHVALSKAYTQKVSGRIMSDLMQKALEAKGVEFKFGKELDDVEYFEDGYKATFTDGDILEDGLLVLCLDNSPALKFLKDNWGPDAELRVRGSTYGAINILLDFDEPVELPADLEIATTTRLKLQPKVLSDGFTISCVICNLTPEILKMPPEVLRDEVLNELNDVPLPKNIRIGWGSEWNGEKWEFSQSSGVLSLHGQLPFFGSCPNVAMCGMMSPRNTPYSSIEAGIEVSRSLCHSIYGTRGPREPLLLTTTLTMGSLLLLIILLVFSNLKK